MKRGLCGFTLFELLSVMTIGLVLFLLLLPAIFNAFSNSFSNEINTFEARCTKTYVTIINETSSKRADFRKKDDTVITVKFDDSFFTRKSASLYAEVEPNQWYIITTRGKRNETWSIFPNCENIKKIQR